MVATGSVTGGLASALVLAARGATETTATFFSSVLTPLTLVFLLRLPRVNNGFSYSEK